MREAVVQLVVEEAAAGLRLRTYLRKKEISLTTVRSLKYLPEGIMVNGRKAHTDYVVVGGDRVLLQLPAEEAFSARPEAIPLDILYHSSEALVINKPAGMVVHPGPSHHGGTLANGVCGFFYQCGYSGGVFRPIGRLDGDTTGLILCALNGATAAYLAKTASKTYLALAGGRMPLGEGVIAAPLAAKIGSAVAQQVDEGGRPSKTYYRVLASVENASLVEVSPQTGRTHQIRAHFAYLGHPLLGDKLYGGSMALLKRHALHCACLAFAELGGNRLRLKAPLPEDMRGAAGIVGLPHTAVL